MIQDPPFAPVICLMGPTASGKSQAALRLADHLPIEIVSVDSALVYRGLNIGTAKPTQAERQQVPHHLIDLLDPEVPYSAARFVSDVKPLIETIRARGRVPILVGGTMLYFLALQRGLDDMPAADPEVRQTLEARAKALGWPALHAELAHIDPATARRLAPHDAQRIQRALEVFHLSGQTMSQLQRQSSARAQASAAWINLALLPSSRPALHERIALRFDRMLEQGVLEEVRQLMQRPGLARDAPSMRAVGYRQIWQHLAGETSFAQMHARALAATRQLAKHQITWLRSTATQGVIDSLAGDADLQVVHAVKAILARH